MSTNNNFPEGWPSEEALQKLANEYFSATPGQSIPGDAAPGTFHTQRQFADNAVDPGNGVNIHQPQNSLPDPHFAGSGNIPSSVAGSGISPSVLKNGKIFNAQHAESQIPSVPSAGSGHVPKSVAGSGISPSAIKQPNSFDLSNPQTSHPDPHFARPEYFQQRKDSDSPLGFTSLMSLQNFPYLSEKSIEDSLRDVFLPHADQSDPFIHLKEDRALNQPAYYFLSEPHFHKTPPGFTGVIPQETHSSIPGLPRPPFDVNLVKKDFPILQERVNGKPLIWLDNAATTQKPKSVIDRLSYYYAHENSNIHRAAHELAARATDAYEGARKKVQHFINAGSPNEIVFVRGTTEAINLVAKSWGEQFLQPGDEIIISHLEHHANIVPWQQLAAKNGLKLRVIPVDEDGQILLDAYGKLLGPKTKLVSFTQVSNALGTVTPAKTMIEMAHAAGAKVLLDGAQSVSHMRADVQFLNCDWFVFSGHKVFGPTGIGILYGKEELLNKTQPWQGGGNMILDVTFEHTKYHQAPSRFEAGTGNIADAVGLGAAIDYVNHIGIEAINLYEHYLLTYATAKLKQIPGLRLIGTARDKAGVISFVLDKFKTEDVGAALNQEGIAVRSGHHCAQPILRRFGVESSVRPSLALYNTCSDIDALTDVLYRLTGTSASAR